MNVNYKRPNNNYNNGNDDGCRYCKQPGHIKRNCPKLVNKNNDTRGRNTNTLPAIIPEEIKKNELSIDNFPVLGDSTKTCLPKWTGTSFSDMLVKEIMVKK